MSDWRNQVVFTAIAIAESVILFTIIAVISAGLSLQYAPLHWATVLFVYLAGMLTSWIVGGLAWRCRDDSPDLRDRRSCGRYI